MAVRKEQPQPPGPKEKNRDYRTEEPADEVLKHLKQTGTGPERVKKIERHLSEWEMTAKELLDWLIEEDVQRGTIEKVGRWIYGEGYFLGGLTQDVSAELESRNRTIRELQEKARAQEAELAALRKQLQVKYRDETRLKHDSDLGLAQEPAKQTVGPVEKEQTVGPKTPAKSPPRKSEAKK